MRVFLAVSCAMNVKESGNLDRFAQLIARSVPGYL